MKHDGFGLFRSFPDLQAAPPSPYQQLLDGKVRVPEQDSLELVLHKLHTEHSEGDGVCTLAFDVANLARKPDDRARPLVVCKMVFEADGYSITDMSIGNTSILFAEPERSFDNGFQHFPQCSFLGPDGPLFDRPLLLMPGSILTVSLWRHHHLPEPIKIEWWGRRMTAEEVLQLYSNALAGTRSTRPNQEPL